MRRRIWHGCYDEGWRDLIVPEAFAHPAKFAKGLIERIVRHGLRRGYWRAGDTLGDPFGGVGLGGVMAGYYGLNWMGVELEPRFVAYAEGWECSGALTDGKTECGDPCPHEPHHVLGNLELHRPRWRELGYDVTIKLIQGDSRQFAALVAADGLVTSPACGANEKSDYLTTEDGKTRQRDARRGYEQGKGSFRGSETYGETPGQIGRLRAGSLDAAVTSPPYVDSVKGQGRHGIDWDKADSVGNRRRGPGTRHEETFSAQAGGYGGAAGNIGNLREGSVDAICTSPPRMKNAEGGLRGVKFRDQEGFAQAMAEKDAGTKRNRHGSTTAARQRQMERDSERTYGDAPGQIGVQADDCYWQAMRVVYEQCFVAVKSGGVLAVVVKDYVKGGGRMPLVDDTLRLLTAVGFVPLERVRAMLVKETVEPGLFESQIVTKKERKSFFRRLAEQNGAPPIDYEEVLFVQRHDRTDCHG